MPQAKFPLYHRPSALVFLDDETSYLEMLAIVMPRDWCITLHTRINDFMAQIHAQAQLWETDVSLHLQMVNQWHAGTPLPGQMLDYWRNQPLRYSLASISVVDYAMPAATGLQVLQMSPPWPPYRILLTGKADEQIAVAAFNEGLIDRFLTKQHPDLVRQLLSSLQQHHDAPMDFHEGIWRNCLRRSQLLALQDRVVHKALNDWLHLHNCVEYVVLPEPFGVLALDHHATAHWLQLEMYKDLSAAAELAQAAGHDASSIAAIALGQCLSNAEWLQSTNSPAQPETAHAQAWGTGGHLIAAHFPLNALGNIGQSHQDFIAALPKRSVDDAA